MNIDTVTTHMKTLQPTAMPRALESGMVGGAAPKKEAMTADATTAKEKPFYECEKEPWLSEPVDPLITNREEYVAHQKMFNAIDLRLMQITYDAYRKELIDTHPDIANKKFGFTLDESASLKIIGYDNSLTETDRAVLTESINNFQELKSMVQANAKMLMTLVDHDHETFGNRYNLNIENFHSIIDYDKILNTGINLMQSEWVRQVQSNAEKISHSYISVSA
ncbi:hypothetical protein SAMN05216593_11211 [Pseudomonas asturiensis]|uniref:Uncharacterized protein n=1 Tax=Pseudomonas asturiensis TaxID=1190415 RepID=A0A1M7PMX8_9PSED|nr:hypothetical protein [Pseudomonas asturiensis]SHN18648.1 hypothetical protein SAMN05216593_11211 [Pseudomonas asturiensis]